MKINLIATAIAAALTGSVALSQDVTPPTDDSAASTEVQPVGIPGVSPTADVPRLPVSVSDQGFFLRQAQLQREIRLLELQARLKELRDELADKPDAPATPAITPGGPIIAVPAATSTPVAVIDAGPPKPPPPRTPFTLISVYGSEGVYRADVTVGTARVTVKPGDTLPDGWTVVTVEQFQVSLRKGGKTETLRLGG